MLENRSFAASILAASLLSLALAAGCGDDTSDGGGTSCEAATECEQVSCPDGSKVRACINKQCVTNPDELCSGGAGGGGW